MIRDLIQADPKLTRLEVRELILRATKRPVSLRTIDRWVATDKAPEWAVRVIQKHRAKA